MNHQYYASKGFTLLEMVIALVILGIISLAIGSYLQLGAQGYTSTIQREQTQGLARFAIEKMTREIRHAAPNSVRTEVIANNRCLSFYPVRLSGFYLDKPSGNSLGFIATGAEERWKAITADDGIAMAVGYGSQQQYDAQNSIQVITEADDVLLATLARSITTASPANRLYAYREKVSYCLQGDKLYRLVDDALPSMQNAIAENIAGAEFTSEGAGINSNGMVHISLSAKSPNSEEVTTYNHSVQVLNVL